MSLPVEFVSTTSQVNSTSGPMAAHEVFTGSPDHTTQPVVLVTIDATGAGTLTVDADGAVSRFDVAPGRCEYVVTLTEPANVFVRFENGSTPQPAFDLLTQFGAYIGANE